MTPTRDHPLMNLIPNDKYPALFQLLLNDSTYCCKIYFPKVYKYICYFKTMHVCDPSFCDSSLCFWLVPAPGICSESWNEHISQMQILSGHLDEETEGMSKTYKKCIFLEKEKLTPAMTWPCRAMRGDVNRGRKLRQRRLHWDSVALGRAGWTRRVALEISKES